MDAERTQNQQCQNKLQQLQWKEKGREKDHAKDGQMR
jgi:hypothetical protein